MIAIEKLMTVDKFKNLLSEAFTGRTIQVDAYIMLVNDYRDARAWIEKLRADNRQLLSLWETLGNDLFRADLPDRSRLRGAVVNGVKQAKEIGEKQKEKDGE